MQQIYEFHFREGFHGQQVEISVDGERVAGFEARTKLQIGVAHIEKLRLRSGQRVELSLPELNLRETIRLSDDLVYVIIDLLDGGLVVQPQKTLPGYV